MIVNELQKLLNQKKLFFSHQSILLSQNSLKTNAKTSSAVKQLLNLKTKLILQKKYACLILFKTLKIYASRRILTDLLAWK